MSKFPITQRTCAGCGDSFSGKGRAKWCSERCRKNQYDEQCVDCGVRVSGTDPGDRPDRTQPRCNRCQSVINGEARRIWTREACLHAFREWFQIHGEPPAVADWDPSTARRINDEERAARSERERDRWPHPNTVRRMFGSWPNGIMLAGFQPYPPHGGGGNEQRRRRVSL